MRRRRWQGKRRSGLREIVESGGRQAGTKIGGEEQPPSNDEDGWKEHGGLHEAISVVGK